MAYKTMLRQLISKWGIMSIEMQTAFDADYAVINEDGTKNYVETEEPNVISEVVVTESEQAEVSEPTETETANVADALFEN